MPKLKNLYQKFLRSQFVRFLLVGGFAALVNVGSRAFLSYYVRFEVAVGLAYLLGVTVAFFLSRHFVFSTSTHSTAQQYQRFWIVNLAAFVQVWLISIGLTTSFFPFIGWTYHPELTAHVIGVSSPAITSYFAHKLFTFG